MHAIHTTRGFVIHSRPYGEAGKLVYIFTEDFGLVVAVAQGIRLEKSKLRPFVQEYSFGIYSLVKGKEYWRLTSAQEINSISISSASTNVIEKKSKSALIARLALLLRRLLQGEQSHAELFGVIDSCRIFLERAESVSDEVMSTLESVIVLRMMHTLGYVGNSGPLPEGMYSENISPEWLTSIAHTRTLLNQYINTALKESHL
ncbi:MAG: DNA repair protein RecO [Candidatus Taylorbacteria bacterium]